MLGMYFIAIACASSAMLGYLIGYNRAWRDARRIWDRET